MIEVKQLNKAYGSVQALRDVSFDISSGEIVGLLGHNGAGKTTIIKTITGYLQPDSGQVRVDGLDVSSDTQAVQARIGYLPENAPVYPELTVQAYLKMMAELRQVDPDQFRAHFSEAVYATGLHERLTQPISQLSKGFRQRVGLAQAILHRPKLLILDEPTVGLDPTQNIEIRRLIKRLSQRSTVLFSTHILPEVEALCDRVIILMNGEVRADARLDELAGANDAVLVLERAVPGVEDAVSTLPGVLSVESRLNGHAIYRVTATAESDLTPALYEAAVDRGWPVRELRREVHTLEMIFNELSRRPTAIEPMESEAAVAGEAGDADVTGGAVETDPEGAKQ